jgi:hypothetical protein
VKEERADAAKVGTGNKTGGRGLVLEGVGSNTIAQAPRQIWAFPGSITVLVCVFELFFHSVLDRGPNGGNDSKAIWPVDRCVVMGPA